MTERARADAAEARAEELRWAEVAARSDGGSWKSRFKACRRRLSEAVEETKEARRTARDVPSLQAEVARLETLLSEAGIASAFDTAGALRKENARLNTRLDQEKERTERIRETAKKLSSESLRLHREVRILGDAEARARSLSDEVFWLRHALEVSKAGKEKLKARLAKLRAAGATLSKLPSDEAAQLRAALRRSRRQKTTINALRKGNARLRRTMRELETRKAALAVQPAKLRAIRKALESELAGLRAVRKTLSKSLSVADADLRRALRRSRRQKATIKSLSRENARLRKGAKTSRNRIETLEVQLERLRATGAVLSRALYGRKSEQQDKPGSEHKRGQQRGAPGHGRTQRPGLDERTEEHNPPPDACVCGRCGQPYAPNGAEESTLVEIEVKAYKRVIRRPRWRRTCECASSPMEVSAPPVPRLFPRTLYGTSFWARFLFEHCACFRPVHRVAAWMSAQGLTVSPGTGLDDGVVIFEDAVREPILAEVLPDVLDRVQLGRARWQQDDGEVLGDLELVGAVPPGAVHQDDAMGLGGDVAADLVEMHLHGGCVGEGEHESGTLGSHGTDCAKEVGVRVALIGGQAWPCSLLRPNAHTPVLLSQPGLVLEPDLDPLGLGQTG